MLAGSCGAQGRDFQMTYIRPVLPDVPIKIMPGAGHVSLLTDYQAQTAPPYRVRDGSARLSLLTVANWQSAGRWQTALALLPYYARNQNQAGTMDCLRSTVYTINILKINRLRFLILAIGLG